MAIAYYDWIAHHASRRPRQTATIDLATDRRFTYQEFDDRIARLASHLRAELKISAGDRVIVLAQNTTDALEVQFACGRLGAIFVPLNWRLSDAELRTIVADCSPAALFHWRRIRATVDQSGNPLRHPAHLHAGGCRYALSNGDLTGVQARGSRQHDAR
jgi:acyl-CoA synthetase (AMP-forming)/AMP-acid ligase II